MSGQPTIIMGIDPGYERVGFGVIEVSGNEVKAIDYGIISTPAEDAHASRLLQIQQDLAGLLEQYKPARVAIEKLFFTKNAKTAIGVGEARGVILLSCEQQGADIVEFTPTEVKIAVTGYGKADKRQVQEMVQRLLGLDDIPRPDDAADALAVAICGSSVAVG